jgi:hypothetical protein
VPRNNKLNKPKVRRAVKWSNAERSFLRRAARDQLSKQGRTNFDVLFKLGSGVWDQSRSKNAVRTYFHNMIKPRM